jgi:hypothetical protein
MLARILKNTEILDKKLGINNLKPDEIKRQNSSESNHHSQIDNLIKADGNLNEEFLKEHFGDFIRILDCTGGFGDKALTDDHSK